MEQTWEQKAQAHGVARCGMAHHGKAGMVGPWGVMGDGDGGNFLVVLLHQFHALFLDALKKEG